MAKTFNDIKTCVRLKVRTFCFAGTAITDEEIGKTTISNLHLTNDPNMPGISPIDALAVTLKDCADINVDLSGDQLSNNPKWTVDSIAQLIYSQTL